ncbi:MAG: tetraacyldisaccharide 4-kinase, partial [Acidobacteriota bacterium]|nr:tetraacyldisaccharide 4-kinase [Acidobacteriota bacterium]
MTNPSGIILAPLGAVYGGVMRARRTLYRGGMLPTHRIASPVISVGNITTGGTGKTPLVDWVARAVALEGRRVCVLSRGYKRADASKRVVVSDSKRILAGVKESGDEPFLLAERLIGKAAVISDGDRVAAARWAEENLGCDAFILDDGFQHLRLARDLNILAIDATNPWGGGKLLPRGRLREPLKEISRADCVIITRSEQVEDSSSLRHEIMRWNNSCLLVTSRTRTSALRFIAGPLMKDGAQGDPLDQIPAQLHL